MTWPPRSLENQLVDARRVKAVAFHARLSVVSGKVASTGPPGLAGRTDFPQVPVSRHVKEHQVLGIEAQSLKPAREQLARSRMGSLQGAQIGNAGLAVFRRARQLHDTVGHLCG